MQPGGGDGGRVSDSRLQSESETLSLTSDFHSTVIKMKDLEKLTLFIVFLCLFFFANLHSKYEWREVERTSVSITVQKRKNTLHEK